MGLSKEAKALKSLMCCEAFERALKELSDENYNDEILNCFSTNEMINQLDSRGELGEAYNAYIKLHLTDIKKNIFSQMSYNEKVKMFAEFLDVPYLATPEEYAEGMLQFINK